MIKFKRLKDKKQIITVNYGSDLLLFIIYDLTALLGFLLDGRYRAK
jgi:hypothetical protein